MSRGIIVLLCVIGVVVLFGGGYGCSALGYRQDCVKAEAGIQAQYKQNQNNYDNMWKRFKEVAAVPKMYAKDLKDLWDGAMKQRYQGEGNGQQPIFKWIQEHNPQLDASVYKQLQRTLEAGRKSFEADQKQLIAKKQQYEVVLKGNRSLFFNMWFGFPRIDLDEFDIVTSDKTEEVFKSKKDNGVLFGDDVKPAEK